MKISEKLAYEIFIIVSFHWIAIVFLVSFSAIIYFRAQKTELLKSYIVLVGMILIWMISKILKTVSPTVELRWFFVVTQYFGVQYLGISLLYFARLYTKGVAFSRRTMWILMVLPTIAYTAVVTNPLHMKFYSYFDFYKDKFGELFMPIQIIVYIYLFAGVIMLGRGYSKQSYFHNRALLSRILAIITLIPLSLNIYYILFKVIHIPWIFSFPVFDITPIASTFALVLFMIPAMNYRFLDISPISQNYVFEKIDVGITLINDKNELLGMNTAFKELYSGENTIEGIISWVAIDDRESLKSYFLENEKQKEIVIQNTCGNFYKIRITMVDNNRILSIKNLDQIMLLKTELEAQNIQLEQAHAKLIGQAKKNREICKMKAQKSIARHVHDILGHSITVVIGLAEIAASEVSEANRRAQLDRMRTVIEGGIFELKQTVFGEEDYSDFNNLVEMIKDLSALSLNLEVLVQGDVSKISYEQSQAVYLLCKEAITNSIKHGKAKNVHIILRFDLRTLSVFIVDDGIGCEEINMSFGLKGMIERFNSVNGEISFKSDGESGFLIKGELEIPI